jgi:predicted metal-dependent phosphoesterase TrpH
MPAQQPFTTLCQLAARRPAGLFGDRADLHLHTTHSDGTYSPAQVVELALRSGLCAIAVTDHDTLAGLSPARAAAAGSGLEVIAGVEISSEFRGRELHLLGYFVCPQDARLADALGRLREDRGHRYREMIERLRDQGVHLDEGDTVASGLAEHSAALGRRHLAELLVRQRKVSTVREAFTRYLHDGGRAVVPKLLLPVGEAIRRVREAGGVASWAHPPESCTLEELLDLREQGLGAVEVEYPGFRGKRVRTLRDWAKALGLAVTGGSDCHGPGVAQRAVGARSVTRQELDALRPS